MVVALVAARRLEYRTRLIVSIAHCFFEQPTPREVGVAEIRPFRGIRYNEGRYADLSAVLAPAHDAVSPAEYHLLCRKSTRNAVQLNVRQPRGARAPRLYGHAAETLESWLGDETLVQDSAPAIYVLDQEFETGGEQLTRRSCIVGLRLEAFGKGFVFAHQETMPGLEKDPLELLKATRMNMVPVLALYSDEDGAVRALLDDVTQLDPVAMGIGGDGVKNVVRAVYHSGLIGRLAKALEEKYIVIADGHHSYEAALAYRDRCRQRRGVPSFDEPHEFIAAALVATTDAGWSIRPLHRIVRGLRGFKPGQFFARAAATYDIEKAPPDVAGILSRLAEHKDRCAFGMVTRSGSMLLLRKTDALPSDQKPARVDMRILHDELFGELLSLDASSPGAAEQITYTADAEECVAAVKRRKGDLAVLVNPARMADVEAAAFADERMPPNSAAFHPGVPGGIVIAPLI